MFVEQLIETKQSAESRSNDLLAATNQLVDMRLQIALATSHNTTLTDQILESEMRCRSLDHHLDTVLQEQRVAVIEVASVALQRIVDDGNLQRECAVLKEKSDQKVAETLAEICLNRSECAVQQTRLQILSDENVKLVSRLQLSELQCGTLTGQLEVAEEKTKQLERTVTSVSDQCSAVCFRNNNH